jgi:protocatechuate 3,4-dioxygenase beta subunit
MRDFTIENLTEIVLEEYGSKTKDPRFHKIVTSLISHLHDFVKDVELTEKEWFEAIMFLTDTGKACDDKRQEFILMSDVLGVSMLVDAINHPKGGAGTESTVLGPFYVPGAPEMEYGASIIKQGYDGEVTLVQGKVTDQEGTPIAGAKLDIWQTAGNGKYDVQDPEMPENNMRGIFTTNAEGDFAFVTEKPLPYSVPTDATVGQLLRASGRHAMRPAHIHYIVTAEGYESLTTHVFADGDEYLNSDAVFATKSSLIGDFNKSDDAELAAKFNLTAPFTHMEFDIGLMPST